jgi:hypothetical protein
VWVGLLVAAYLAVTFTLWRIFGRQVALAFATIGLAALFFKIGKIFQKRDYQKDVKEIEAKRQEKYDEIDDRTVTRDDILKRLRDKSY